MHVYTYGETPKEIVDKLSIDELKMELVGDEREAFTKVVNMGIDSHLEAFTQSEFSDNGQRMFISLHPSEVWLAIRRLKDLGDYASSMLRISILEMLDIEEI